MFREDNKTQVSPNRKPALLNVMHAKSRHYRNGGRKDRRSVECDPPTSPGIATERGLIHKKMNATRERTHKVHSSASLGFSRVRALSSFCAKVHPPSQRLNILILLTSSQHHLVLYGYSARCGRLDSPSLWLGLSSSQARSFWPTRLD